ncbi:MAG: hypothetical protein ACF8PG_01750, partial [Maioricimonas sp. JB045]
MACSSRRSRSSIGFLNRRSQALCRAFPFLQPFAQVGHLFVEPLDGIAQFLECAGHLVVLALVTLGLFAFVTSGTITFPFFAGVMELGLHRLGPVPEFLHDILHADVLEVFDRRLEMVHPAFEVLGQVVPVVVAVLVVGVLVDSVVPVLFPPVLDLVQQIAFPLDLAADLVPFAFVGAGLFKLREMTFQV